jgi:hypothetical protein
MLAPGFIRHGIPGEITKFVEERMSYCRKSGLVLFVVLTVLLLASSVMAQDTTPPKSEIFLGYQWLNPGGKVPVPLQPFNSGVTVAPPSMSKGLGVSYTYNFLSALGLEGDFGNNWGKFGSDTTVSAGPRITWRQDHVNLFAHALVGYNRFVENGFDPSNGGGAILGGGMDLKVIKSLSIRLIEADYVFSHQRFTAGGNTDAYRPGLNGARIRSGIVWNIGGAPVVPPTAACSVQPAEVMVGEPITATVTTTNYDPKHTLSYSWTSTGGKITGKDTTASIDTNGVAGGSYVVTANVTDGKMKKGGETSCTANFTVKELPKNPPTMSCSANPTSVQAGAPVNLTCTCTSPDNSPVTVSGWTASAGTISGSGSTATLNTTGAPAGNITVNASCTDQRGLNTSASTQVAVENPPPPPPQASKLSECSFENMDKIKKPWRVDNECKAILDDVAKNLQQNLDNKVVVVGNAEPTEKRPNLAAERAVNSKAYLSGGESKLGIDPSRIETRTGSAGTKTAEYWVVPAGATFSAAGTTPVDETKVKAVPDHPKPAVKKAMKKMKM